MALDFNSEKSLLQQEQELLNAGWSEDELARLYPNIVGNGHPSVCLCPACDPDERYEPFYCPTCGELECPHLRAAQEQYEEEQRQRQARIDAINAAWAARPQDEDHPF